jgi:hypothetical protein
MAQTVIQNNAFRNELNNLKQEVQTLRSLVIGMIGADKEGSYKPKFVKEILEAAKENPIYRFQGARAFLQELKRK